MDTLLIVTVVKLIALAAVIILFIVKLRTTQRFRARHKHIGMRWLLWYDEMQILGTSSPSRRDFMVTHNKLSTFMWVCLLLFVLMFIIPF